MAFKKQYITELNFEKMDKGRDTALLCGFPSLVVSSSRAVLAAATLLQR